MFKLPALPTPRSEIHELADFAELLALHNGVTSAREIQTFLGQVGENDRNEGAEDDEDIASDLLEGVFEEIGRRSAACGTGYPFRVESLTVLKHDAADQSPRSDVYRYLLLSTRLNMTSDKVQGGVDGTTILEELAAVVLRCYLGYERAKSFVFGTAVPGGFPQKVTQLCNLLGEGGTFSTIDPSAAVNANDDKLDAVAWVPFKDGREGKIIIFCQCKTGTNWKDQITQLQPAGFIHRWMSARKLFLDPLRAFCISESADPARWAGLAVYAGLVFDRVRVIDFLDHTDPVLHQRVKLWNAGARAVAAKAM
jgi:hypothetical protein